MSGLEIERKFLVRGRAYKELATASSHIRQGYICSGHGRTVRVRMRDCQAYLTIKGPGKIDPENGGAPARYEFEKEISLDEAQHLMELCEPPIIEKTRYLVPSPDGKHTFEVDEFYGDNAGLVMAEVELGKPNEDFKKPDFIGMEVTDDSRFYNSHLRRLPYLLWRESIPTEYRHTELE